MTMTMSDLVQHAMKKYYPEDYRAFVRQGRAAGRAETILDARGLDVPDDVREQILGCQDLKRLVRWTKRAVTAKTAAEVVAG